MTKTGSLGARHFIQDCGVTLSPDTDRPRASFGYCAQGFRLPGAVVDTLMGLVGLEIIRALGLDPTPNMDWTPQGARLLSRDFLR